MKRAYIFNTWMQTTFTDEQWFKTYQRIDLNRKKKETLPLKNRWTCQKRRKRIYFGGWCKVSKRAAWKSQWAAILSGEDENWWAENLVPNLKDKKRYVVHIKAFNHALKHGLKLKKVHLVIEFQQNRWMKAYIMLNTRLRKDAKN